jgi:hypothetical protein
MPEATWGETPVAGNCVNLRFTGEGLDYAISKESSKEINSTRTISSVTSVSASTSGNITGELSYQEYDAFIKATLMSSWTVYGTNGV